MTRVFELFGKTDGIQASLWCNNSKIVSSLNDVYLTKSEIRHRGGPLESGLQRVIKDITIGSMLIQSDSKTSEPFL